MTPAVEVTVADVNGDGRDEILVRTPALSVTLNPARGGTLTEIAMLRASPRPGRRVRPAARDLPRAARGRPRARPDRSATRHAEKEPGLHRLLTYDRFRRASLLDGLFDVHGDLDPVEPWGSSRLALGDAVFEHAVERRGEGVEIALHHRLDHSGLSSVDKRVTRRRR